MKIVRFRKKDGDLIGKHNIRTAFESLEDGEYAMQIKEWKDTRSNIQNAFIHVCFDVYSKEMGYSRLASKYILKKMFGINYLENIDGKQELIVRDTSDYNVDEMKVFIDRMLNHFEYDCGIIVDPEIRKQYKIDSETGEMEEL